MEAIQLTPDITAIRVPFFDIFTTVFLVKTEAGNLLFDTATYPTDITDIILPALAELGVDGAALSAVLISHPHRDHIGGLAELLARYPDLTVIAGSNAAEKTHTVKHLVIGRDGDIVLDDLRIVSIPGHTTDAIALLDTRTGTLLSGDCLQLYGIFGSGAWGANINFPKAHLAALDRLAALDIAAIYPAHVYHPVGDAFVGKDAIARVLDACREPLFVIRDMIKADPEATDTALAARYNEQDLPTVGSHVFAAVRRDLL